MLSARTNRTQVTKNERGCAPLFRQFVKSLRGAINFGSNAIETGVHKFLLGALQRKPRASAISLGSLAMGNML